MATRPFVDYYEVLQLSPRASSETIERVYRLLAKRYHPDNQATGDDERFRLVLEAYDELRDAERRTAYDVQYDEAQGTHWQIYDQQSAANERDDDRRILHAILSLLYIERRRNPAKGGLGIVLLERALNVPQEHLQFPVWYMKEHGWIEMMDNGQLAITISGIDKLADKDLALREDRLLSESSVSRSKRADVFTGPRALDRVAGVAG